MSSRDKVQAYQKAARTSFGLTGHDSTDTDEELLLTARKRGDKINADFLQIALKFAAYQKEQNCSETFKSPVSLEALTSSMMSTGVAKMADTILSKPKLSGL